MTIIDSSGAIPAKARAKYGRRLTSEDYNNLIHCKTVAEVANYLKSNTYYNDVLSQLNEHNIHRGQVELLLKQKMFYDFDELCRYESRSGNGFSKFIVMRYEINQLIQYLILLNTGKSREYIFSLPSYFDNYTDIKLSQLAACKDYSAFLETISHTPYYGVLKEFAPKDSKTLNLAAIENSLYRYMYDQLYTAIGKHNPKSERNEIKKLFDMIIDFSNIGKIYRLKKSYKMKGSAIESYLLPYGTVTKEQREALCSCDMSEFFNLLGDMHQFRNVMKNNNHDMSRIPMEARYKLCRNKIYFSQNPGVVMIAYMYIVGIEVSNIITIVESVRYSVAPEVIEEMIIH